MHPEEWSIQQIARIAGTTSRTLRHYGEIGLLPASRIGGNGYRYYDRDALVRLQRILLMRDLGVGLPQIAFAIEDEQSQERALSAHLKQLHQERERLARQIVSVERTIAVLKEGGFLMAEQMFDGFDHARHRDEVISRWGARAYADGDRWWRAMSADDRAAFQRRSTELSRDWIAAAQSGIASDSAPAQALAERHVRWLAAIPGTPAAEPGGDVKGYVLGLGDMYVADERFAANYASDLGHEHDDRTGAQFVRDALRTFAEANL